MMMMLRSLGIQQSPGTENEQQSGEHYPSGSSSAVCDQLYGVSGLWLVQLPSCWQDVRAQRTRHSDGRQPSRHGPGQRLDLGESELLHHPISDAEYWEQINIDDIVHRIHVIICTSLDVENARVSTTFNVQ